LATLDADAVPLFDAPKLFAELAALRSMAGAAMTLLARRVDQSCTWRSEGYRSAAGQIAARSGTSVNAARTLLETSQRVADLPKTEAVVRSGALSPEQAAAVSAAAVIAPDQEDGLLELAVAVPLARLQKESLRAKAS